MDFLITYVLDSRTVKAPALQVGGHGIESHFWNVFFSYVYWYFTYVLKLSFLENSD